MVVEHCLRSKGQQSFALASSGLHSRAELLLELECNALCSAVSGHIAAVAANCEQHQHQQRLCPQLEDENSDADNWRVHEVPDSTTLECSKLLAGAVGFLMSTANAKVLLQLKSHMQRAALKSLVRSGGLRSFMLLFHKVINATTGRHI